jgi:hypothetical protein
LEELERTIKEQGKEKEMHNTMILQKQKKVKG